MRAVNAAWVPSKAFSSKLTHLFMKKSDVTGLTHAQDFGIKGVYNKANRALFEQALRDHVSKAEIVGGAYHGIQGYHFVDRLSGLWVFVDRKGNLVAAMRLGFDQLRHLFAHGNVQ